MSKDTYKEPKTYQLDNMTARVYIPDITTEERNRRMTAIQKAAGELLKGGRS